MKFIAELIMILTALPTAVTNIRGLGCYNLGSFAIVTGFVMMGANPWWYLVALGINLFALKLLMDVKTWF